MNHGCPEAKVSNPTIGLSLFWVYDTFRGNSNHKQDSQQEAGRILTQKNKKTVKKWPNAMIAT
jgi:hypothetical protein